MIKTLRMNIPDFSKPSKDCFLTVDKNGIQLKAGDVLASYMIPLHGFNPERNTYAPVEQYDDNLIVPHYGSFLVTSFVKNHCVVTE